MFGITELRVLYELSRHMKKQDLTGAEWLEMPTSMQRGPLMTTGATATPTYLNTETLAQPELLRSQSTVHDYLERFAATHSKLVSVYS